MYYDDEMAKQIAEHNSPATHILLVFVFAGAMFAMHLLAENLRIYKAKNSNK